MDLYRFFVRQLPPSLGEDAAPIRLPDDQAHHARAVLRLEPGVPVLLFDGKGHSITGTLAMVSKHEVTALATGPLLTERAPVLQLTLATAIPKGDRAEWLVDQASQLEVSALQWLDTDRSVVKPKEGGGKLAKWQRLAIESAKQCGRTRLMSILEPLTLHALLADPPPGLILWLEPRDHPATRPLARLLPEPSTPVTALIGPEGGWSARELDLLESLAQQKRIHRVLLTRTILRIETAAAAAAALLLAEK